MNKNIVHISQDYVEDLFAEKLTNQYTYHDIAHTLKVKEWVLKLAEKDQLTDKEKELLSLAALFHDTGFTKAYVGHEAASIDIATEFLSNRDYPKEGIEQINNAIKATQMGVEPKGKLGQYLKDADLNM